MLIGTAFLNCRFAKVKHSLELCGFDLNQRLHPPRAQRPVSQHTLASSNYLLLTKANQSNLTNWIVVRAVEELIKLHAPTNWASFCHFCRFNNLLIPLRVVFRSCRIYCCFCAHWPHLPIYWPSYLFSIVLTPGKFKKTYFWLKTIHIKGLALKEQKMIKMCNLKL